MTIRNKKPKCATANKACGMACKPKAAICADQRKKLVANAKKSGLKGQAAKDYVKARIDRYRKLVDSKGAEGLPEKATKKKAEDTAKTEYNWTAADGVQAKAELVTDDPRQMGGDYYKISVLKTKKYVGKPSISTFDFVRNVKAAEFLASMKKAGLA